MAQESKRSEAKQCPMCGGDEVRVSKVTDHFVYGEGEEEKSLSVEVDLFHCLKCDFQFTGSETEEKRHEAVCHHLGFLAPRDIVALRKQHRLSRKEFANFTGLGEASLGRWESSSMIQSRANDNYIFLLKFFDNFLRIQQRQLDLKEGLPASAISGMPKAIVAQRFQILAPIQREFDIAASFRL